MFSIFASRLTALFDDDTKKVVFRWTNTISGERKKSHTIVSKRRPDGCMTLTEDNDDEINIGFVEVKTSKDQTNHYKVNLDTYRLGVFSKDAIDTNKLSGALAVQATGKF